MSTAMDFEKPILEIQRKIEELKKMSLESGMDLNKDIEILEHEAEDFKNEQIMIVKGENRFTSITMSRVILNIP